MVINSEDVMNIMGGMENSSGIKLNDHKRKLKNRFEICKKLGQGTYGKVQLGINKETHEKVAIKTIKKSKIETEADLIRIRREIQIMSSVQHPNIIHIYEVFENKEKMVLVMEMATGGELYDYLSDKKCLEENEARRIFRQISTAVYYCHKHKICHRDLKLENILLDENGSAKIADFGLSNVFSGDALLNTFCGSPLYASPEIVKGSPYEGPEVDCWSLGVLLYTLVYGAMPFDGSNFKRLVRQITTGDYYEPKEPSRASSLIRTLLTVQPEMRAKIEDICAHWWVNETYPESCLKEAEYLAGLTPVRLDLLLGVSPCPKPKEPLNQTEKPLCIEELAVEDKAEVNEVKISEDTKNTNNACNDNRHNIQEEYLNERNGHANNYENNESEAVISEPNDSVNNIRNEEKKSNRSMVINEISSDVFTQPLNEVVEMSQELVSTQNSEISPTKVSSIASELNDPVKEESVQSEKELTSLPNEATSKPIIQESTVTTNHVASEDQVLQSKSAKEISLSLVKEKSASPLIAEKIIETIKDENVPSPVVDTREVEKSNSSTPSESREEEANNHEEQPKKPQSEKRDNRDSKVIKAAQYWNNFIGEVISKNKSPESTKQLSKPKKIVSAGVGQKGYNELKTTFENGKDSLDRRNSRKSSVGACNPGLKVTDAKTVFEIKAQQPPTPVIYRRNSLAKDGTKPKWTKPKPAPVGLSLENEISLQQNKIMQLKPEPVKHAVSSDSIVPVPEPVKSTPQTAPIITVPTKELPQPTLARIEPQKPSTHTEDPKDSTSAEEPKPFPPETKSMNKKLPQPECLPAVSISKIQLPEEKVRLSESVKNTQKEEKPVKRLPKSEKPPKPIDVQKKKVDGLQEASPTKPEDNKLEKNREIPNTVVKKLNEETTEALPKSEMTAISNARAKNKIKTNSIDPKPVEAIPTLPPPSETLIPAPPLIKSAPPSVKPPDLPSPPLETAALQEKIVPIKLEDESAPLSEEPKAVYHIPLQVEGVSNSVDDKRGNYFPSNSLSRRRWGSRKKRMSSAYSDSSMSDEDGPFLPFPGLQNVGLQKHMSLGKHGCETAPMFRLRKTRPPFTIQREASFSSDGEDELEDDGFREMTAENLFSTLLTRVKSLTRRIHDEHEEQINQWHQNKRIINHPLNPGGTHARLERSALRNSLKRAPLSKKPSLEEVSSPSIIPPENLEEDCGVSITSKQRLRPGYLPPPNVERIIPINLVNSHESQMKLSPSPRLHDSENNDVEEDRQRRVSRFLRPDFYDTPKEESIYVKMKELEEEDKKKSRFLKKIQARNASESSDILAPLSAPINLVDEDEIRNFPMNTRLHLSSNGEGQSISCDNELTTQAQVIPSSKSVDISNSATTDECSPTIHNMHIENISPEIHSAEQCTPVSLMTKRRTILPYGGAKSDGPLNKHALISSSIIAAAERRKKESYCRSSTLELPTKDVNRCS